VGKLGYNTFLYDGWFVITPYIIMGSHTI